jgi:hypothetical protein
VYNTCNNSARSNFSGGIDGRPIWEYIRANSFDNSAKTLSATWRTARKG